MSILDDLPPIKIEDLDEWIKEIETAIPTLTAPIEEKVKARLEKQLTTLRGVRKWMKAQVKCDGNHGYPRCADPECWQDL